MHTNQPPPNVPTPPGTRGETERLSSPVSRRRTLLRSLAAAGGVAGSGLPLSAHAYFSGKYCTHPYTGKNHQATVSGCQSVILSLKTGNTNLVKGHNCQHYKTQSNWPTGCSNGYGLNFTSETSFAKVFRCPTTNYRNQSLRWLCINRPTSDEAHWAAAIANAKKRSPFSYTQKEVVDFYNGSRYAAALGFFKDFCETLA